MTGRFKRNIKSNSYLVHYRPYQGAKKGKQFVSSTKWGLGDNVALRLMECLTPTFSFDLFMDNYFTSFRLLTHLGVNNIRGRGVFNKNSVCKYTIIGDKHLEKKERGHFEYCSVHQAKTLCNLCGWLERQQSALHSFF